MTEYLMKPRYLMTVEELTSSFSVSKERPPHPLRRFRPEGMELKPRNTVLPGVFSRVGIALPKDSLEDTPYTFQIGISSSTLNPNFVEWRERTSIELTDSRASGVLVFNGYDVIASYTADTDQKRPPWSIQVHPDYRGKGLSTLAVLQWFKAAPLYNLVGWPVTEISAMAFVSAHKRYVEWAILQDEPVPQNVIDSVRA
jgi:GNAT superfamily N-acetyltransferase